MLDISPEDIIQRNQQKFLANKLGEEIVMMNLENGNFVAMNKVGADIWELSEQPLTVAELTVQLMRIYNISEKQCMEETIKFLRQSTTQNIFVIQSSTTC